MRSPALQRLEAMFEKALEEATEQRMWRTKDCWRTECNKPNETDLLGLCQACLEELRGEA